MAEIPRKSGRSGEIIGLLDIGDDIGGFPERIGGDRAQADGPVAFAGAGHADDVEFDVAAERMPVEGPGHPPLDLVEGRRGLCKIRIEVQVSVQVSVHVSPFAWRSARPWRRAVLWGYCWDGFG